MNNSQYPIHEIVFTVQGEGFHSGTPSIFVRLGGCNVGCTWCDIKESWNADLYKLKKSSEILDNIKQYKCKTVVITGGEPLLYNLSELTEILKSEGYKIHLETSGAYKISGAFDWVCFSPKKFKKPIDDFAKNANELKVIIYNKSDFNWAENYRKTVSSHCKLYLQAEWSRRNTANNMIIDYIKNHSDWKISLQTHKYLDIP